MQYQITISHPGLNKIRRISGQDKWLVEEKARAQKAAWDEQWAARCEAEERRKQRGQQIFLRDQKKQLAAERSLEAEAALAALSAVLVQRKAKHEIWNALKDKSLFAEAKPRRPSPRASSDEPLPTHPAFQPALGFLDAFIPSRRRRKKQAALARFQAATDAWSEEKAEIAREYQAALAKYETAVQDWERRKVEYHEAQTQRNRAVDELKRLYLEKSPDAITEYIDAALSLSDYPDFCPKEHAISFVKESGVLLVDYRLPAVSDLPTLKQVKYIASRDATEEIHARPSETNARYDDLLYRICLRTIFEVFDCDTVQAVSSVVFNGWVSFIDPATGKDTQSCIMSVHAARNEFLEINLENVDPKACFKALKGVGSSKLHGMAAVAPLLRMNRNDVRFIPPMEIADSVDEGTNLAAIGWEDFEHLIREIFEKEFSKDGGEVKVTRASRDGGVDAVAFDPDPIRGGKIVIQAKRYTNTVGVSAVRDLYGTVMNEGATKGILVTTASFGPDAYAFAKDKPLTLLDGGNLLYLLQRHGHKAYINLSEAKETNVFPLKRSTKG